MNVFEDVQCYIRICIYIRHYCIWTYVGIIGVGGIYGQDETGMLLLGVRVYNKDVFSKISEIFPLENLRYQRFCRQISSINSEHFAVD